MQHMQWQVSNGEYRAFFLYGTVIINEQTEQLDNPVETFTFYVARMVDLAGNPLASAPREFQEFEEAEAWAFVTIGEIDQSSDRRVANERMLLTLELCQHLLASDLHPTFLHWLTHIKHWIADPTPQNVVGRTHPEAHQQDLQLEWHKQYNTYEADTPYGIANITERHATAYNRSSTYFSAQLAYSPTHRLWKPGEFTDFSAAEAWIQAQLKALRTPCITKENYDYIFMTLSICQEKLPEDVDPIHVARLEYLQIYIEADLM